MRLAMRRHRVHAGLFALLLALGVGSAAAQSADLAAAKPGRNPAQPIDSAYTKKIHEYTTEKFFLSPLVDYLPASKTVPTPTAVLGDIAGAPTKLPYSKEVYDYMRLLAKSSPRVKVFSIGTTEEGREMIAVAVASEALINKLDENRANLAKLADPRTIKMNDAEAERIAATAAPIYYITGTIHSTEAGAPTALMELAYRLAVDESPYVRNIRDHLITLITPIVEVDGRDRVVDIYNWKVKHPNETAPSVIYWGHYVAHDNNRDAMGMTLKLTQNVLNTYVGFKAQVLHDLHESVAFLYDNTIGDGPYNAWLDPLLTNEWQMIGWNNVQEMTRYGMPGVFAHGNFDTWSPGYLMFIAATHNGISRLYETFGNGGTAETVERTLSPNETERTWFKQNPPLPRVKWSLRNNNNYEQTGLLVSLNYFATNRRLFLQNFYEKSKRSILKARTEGPAAYVLSASDPRPGAQAELLGVLRKQAVEISRATAPFSVQMRVKRTIAAGGRGGRGGAAQAGGAANADSAGARPVMEMRDFPAGSYVIRMDQPYSRIADALLDYQYWSPNDPQKNPYDDTGWTFPEGFAVQAVRVTDATVLDVPVERVTGEIRSPGGVTGSGDTFLINHNGDNALIALRYRFRTAEFQVAEEPFEAAGQKFNRGSFIIRGVAQADLDKTTRELGLKVYAAASAPSVKMHAARAARTAILHTWQSTQTEGWWRMAFDILHVPYDYLSVQDVSKDASLNAKYDVIVFPPAGGSGQSIIDGMPMWRNPMPWKNSPETPNIGTWAQTDDVRPGLGLGGLANLQDFVKRGGVLLAATNAADFAVQFGFTNGVSTNSPRRGEADGSLLRSKIVDETSPIVYGIPDNLAVYTNGGESYGVSNQRGGRGGRGGGAAGGGGSARGGGGTARATGRGTPDDVDEVQGRQALDPRFKAPPRPTVQPWQATPLTDDQFRNPLNIIPPDQRPRVALRFADQRELLVSGLLDGGGDIAQRPVVVDAPLEKGHVVLFAINPIWRGETIGSYFMVFNTLLNFDNLNAGRKLDVK
jgi:Zinc carboxypeptidase